MATLVVEHESSRCSIGDAKWPFFEVVLQQNPRVQQVLPLASQLHQHQPPVTSFLFGSAPTQTSTHNAAPAYWCKFCWGPSTCLVMLFCLSIQNQCFFFCLLHGSNEYVFVEHLAPYLATRIIHFPRERFVVWFDVISNMNLDKFAFVSSIPFWGCSTSHEHSWNVNR